MGNLFPVKRDLPASRETWIGRLFFREAWNGSFISRETWFARQSWDVILYILYFQDRCLLFHFYSLYKVLQLLLISVFLQESLWKYNFFHSTDWKTLELAQGSWANIDRWTFRSYEGRCRGYPDIPLSAILTVACRLSSKETFLLQTGVMVLISSSSTGIPHQCDSSCVLRRERRERQRDCTWTVLSDIHIRSTLCHLFHPRRPM